MLGLKRKNRLVRTDGGEGVRTGIISVRAGRGVLEDGKDAVRILYYKNRIAPHQASLEDDWHKIQTATLGEKKNRILQKWFEKARVDVFINIDDAYDQCGIMRQ